MRGGRGMGPERGRGRGLGRGRGEGGFLQRGTSYEETGGGGFGRPTSHNRTDGWEEVGSKRNYQNRYDETGVPRREFTRSVSSTDNWRGRDEEEEGDGDWRKAGSSKWGARGNWRDPSNRERGGFDSRPNGVQRGGRTYQRSRNSESWDDEGENLPEWSMPDSDDVEEPGTFDSSGAFVFNKLKGMVRGGRGDHEENPEKRGAPGFKKREAPSGTDSQQNDDSKDKSDSDFNVQNGDGDTDTSVKENRDKSPRDKIDNNDRNKRVKSNQQSAPQEVERPRNKSQMSDNTSSSDSPTVPPQAPKQTSVANKNDETELSDTTSSAQKQKSAPSTTETKKSTKKASSKKESQMEQEALDRLKEKAENMVLEAIDVEAEDEEAENTQEDENTKKWFYLDPQGDVQGPFASSEMAEWFSAGYFTMNLKVKRGCDDRYSPLGELIKRWGRVPFLPGAAPPPLLNSPQRQASPDLAAQQQQDQLKLLQQQYVLQQHMMHQQMVLRHLQMQQVMTQLQENEEFKNLPPLHQQQLATEILLKQPILPVHGVPTSEPKLSPRSPPTERVGGESPRPMSHNFHRSMSQPADLTKSPPQTEEGSIWGSINPAVQDLLNQGTGSVWDLDPKSVISATDLEAQLEKARKETDDRQKEEEEKLRAELFQRKQEELRLQKEEIQREKERMEMERQKYMEMKKLEEIRQKEEAEKQLREEKEMQRRKAEEERRQIEEKMRRQKEEEQRRRKEEEMRLQELHRQQAELRQQEIQRQELIRQQEIQRQQELKRQEEEEMEKQKQLEIQKRQEAQRLQELQQKQQEALRKLQQEQLAKIQLPSHAQWANQQSNAMGASGVPSKTQSLLEIQEQEERERFEQETMQMQQRKAEAQRQQMFSSQQQQQQKSWSSQVMPSQGNGKTLLEIQEEQSKQETERKNERQQSQQNQAKQNLTLGAASVWGGVTSPSHWASEGAWGNAVRAQTNSQQNSGTSNGAGSLGFWDDAIISSKRAPAASSRNSGGQTNNAEFPALKGGQVNTSAPVLNTTSKLKPSKMKKEEEAVQKLFQGNISKGDDFTQWCERELRNMATSVDIPTFISFLKEVDSPYEVHDYVRSYLGENKAAIEFAKQFLERRSQNRNKSRQQQQQPEDSIWGPAPARDFRQSQPSNQVNEFETQKAKGKKKKKMTKIDSSILGFTVHADPTRKNVGEIDNVNK